MCGIAGIHLLDERLIGKLDVERFARELLLGIDHRGGDATGFAAVDAAGLVTVQKAAVDAGSFLIGWRGIENRSTRTVLLHTRLATQGLPAWPENNHPVRWGSLHVVHNGVIRNDGDVFTRAGKVRHGEVDSEAIPAVIAEAGWKCAADGLETLDGSFAIAAVDESRPGEVLLARAGWSPLVWVSNGRILAWASTEGALLDAWKAVIGTPPRWARITSAADGDMLRTSGRKLTRTRFKPFEPIRKPVRLWTSAWPGHEPYSYPARPDACNVPVRPAIAAAAEVKPTADVEPVAVETTPDRDGWTFGFSFRPVEPEPVERCACCHEWTDSRDLDVILGESVCRGCYAVLADELDQDAAKRTGSRARRLGLRVVGR